jgi:hypothetical protein
MSETAHLSRRAFLRRGATVAVAGTAVAVFGSNAVAGAQETKEPTAPTFTLTPNGGACNACRQHAKNKVFRSDKAADTYRAHKGCHCTVGAGQELTLPVFTAVFGDAGQHADRRDPKIAELLDKGTLDGAPVPVLAIGAPILLAAGGGAAYLWWRRQHREPAGAGIDHGDWK